MFMSLGKARLAATCIDLNNPTGTAQPEQQPAALAMPKSVTKRRAE